MAYSSTRVQPAVTPGTDAGLAIDIYLDGEVDQLYLNTNYLLASMTSIAYGGPYFYVGTSAGVASLTTITNGMITHATDTGKQGFVDGTTKYNLVDNKHNQSVTGVKSFTTISATAATVSTTPTNDADIVRLDSLKNYAAIYSQAF